MADEEDGMNMDTITEQLARCVLADPSHVISGQVCSYGS
jgi:hypothetical protein